MNLINNLSAHLFWETLPEKLDLDKHKRYIIPRVMDRGNIDDVQKVLCYYNRNELREVLLSAPYLDKKTISYFAFYFDCSLSDFRAYRRKKEHQWS
jgi:hypothetical protein